MAYTNLISLLPKWQLDNKTILIRADLNVPLKDGRIHDDFRLKALLPTLQYIQQAGGTSVVITHLGRPTNHEEQLSTKHLVPWFIKNDFNTVFCPDLNSAYCVSTHPQAEVIIMENSRFWPGESTKDPAFAAALAQGMDYYVNDAFGSEHRDEASLTILPQLFPADRRSIGFLVERELQALTKLINPVHPFVVIIGGSKIADKLSLLEGFINRADTILVCPALSFTFAASVGIPVGKSLVDTHVLEQARQLLKKVSQSSTQLMLPIDYLVATNSWDGPLSYVPATNIPPDSVGIACGPNTVKQWQPLIAHAQTIFFNGPMGDLSRPQTTQELHDIMEEIAQNNSAYRVIGGGDTLAVARSFSKDSAMNFCSTGGGATLAFLAGKPLPGLTIFEESRSD